MEKTLYISDLDGTLLHRNEKISAYSAETINRLSGRGMLFTYATARSHITAVQTTEGLLPKLPVIVYNGAFMIDLATGKISLSNFFTAQEAHDIAAALREAQIKPLVYAFIEGVEQFSYEPLHNLYSGLSDFLLHRPGDPRHRQVPSSRQLEDGDIFYFTCIEQYENLLPIYEKYKETFHCIFGKDIYSGEWWLEILPKQATKAHAMQQLKEYLGCDKVIVFGDGINDREMFLAADECYAVENAAPGLKEIATGIIACNEDDGVANWLLRHYPASN